MAKIIKTGVEAKEAADSIVKSEDYKNHPDKSAGYFNDGGTWVAYDNSYGDMMVEEFKTDVDAIKWINEEEVEDTDFDTPTTDSMSDLTIEEKKEIAVALRLVERNEGHEFNNRISDWIFSVEVEYQQLKNKDENDWEL